jgi:CRP-like cAMP-binding protein
MIEVTAAVLAAQPFLHGMPPAALAALAADATVVTFPQGHRIFEEGGYAGKFWLIRSGRVALDVQVPGEGPVTIETIGMGEVLGWSWLFPPYKWAFAAACAAPVEVIEFDAAAVRARCAADPEIGYELTRRLIRVLASRLTSTRARLASAEVRSPHSEQ